MKPLFEFVLACLLVSIAGCSAIASIFQMGMWAALIFLFRTKARQ